MTLRNRRASAPHETPLPEPAPPGPVGAARYDWPQMRRFWESHASARSPVDYDHDDTALENTALDNVCQSGAPPLVNRYYQRGQRRAFASLLRAVPVPGAGRTALDVGCGAARWSRLLAARGYSVTGIDLQDRLIEENRRRYPNVDFHVAAIQDFETDERFDLIASVTVLQHLPYAEQERAIQAVGRLVRPGGYILILENVSDRVTPTVFAHSRQGWIHLFADAGLFMVKSSRYDYSPTLRTYYALTQRARLGWLPSDRTELPDPESAFVRKPQDRRSSLATVDRFGKVLCSCLDSLIDPMLFVSQPALPAAHCALLFHRPEGAASREVAS